MPKQRPDKDVETATGRTPDRGKLHGFIAFVQVKSRITPRYTWSRTPQPQEAQGLPAERAGCGCERYSSSWQLRGMSDRGRLSFSSPFIGLEERSVRWPGCGA